MEFLISSLQGNLRTRRTYLCLKLNFHTEVRRLGTFWARESPTKAKRSGGEACVRFLNFWSLDGARGTRFERNLAQAAGFRGEETFFFCMLQYNHSPG